MKKIIIAVIAILLFILIFVLTFKLININKEINLLKKGNQNYSTGAQLYDLSNTPEGRIIEKKYGFLMMLYMLKHVVCMGLLLLH